MDDDQRQEMFEVLLRELVTDVPVSCRVVRAPYLVWRWSAVLLVGGEAVDERLCLSRRGAGRRAGRMVLEECRLRDARVAAVTAVVFGG